MGHLFIEELVMDYDIYVNYDDLGRMTDFHLVNKFNPICNKYFKTEIQSDLVIRV